MLRLRIDNREITAEDGSTILEAASGAGISIPVLCHSDGVEHYTSCMICMVKERKSGKFLPACSSLAGDGMDIDTAGEDVISMRRKSAELLLSEHRADCEAPCRVVCPAGYNIPLMNRHLMSGRFDDAVKLTFSEVTTPDILCRYCPGYCENACRRKKIDIPVSIRNIKLFIAGPAPGNAPGEAEAETLIRQSRQSLKESKSFSSHIGKMEPGELERWLLEAKSNQRVREISNNESAATEAGNCVHCDCRAADECRLREVAGLLSVKDPKGKIVNSPAEKKINRESGLIFENAKCIKCGLCVRVCEDSTDNPSLCFINRGFVSIISEPLTQDFRSILREQAIKSIDICPTGALSEFE